MTKAQRRAELVAYRDAANLRADLAWFADDREGEERHRGWAATITRVIDRNDKEGA